eukprot:SM000010S04242  [mRNA]  locus=s10:487594:488483:- [translate_table: standard]
MCASRHMAAEQRRRARINDRLDALRTIVPHSARSNTAAFLTEVFDYVSSLHKQLDKLRDGSIDLNIAATEGGKAKEAASAAKESASALAEQHQPSGRGGHKRSRSSNCDEESELETESEESPATNCNDNPGSGDCTCRSSAFNLPPPATTAQMSPYPCATSQAITDVAAAARAEALQEPSKRRRCSTFDSCSNSYRLGQAVHRPIALKPQP